jgi:hypothetical protein
MPRGLVQSSRIVLHPQGNSSKYFKVFYSSTEEKGSWNDENRVAESEYVKD